MTEYDPNKEIKIPTWAGLLVFAALGGFVYWMIKLVLPEANLNPFDIFHFKISADMILWFGGIMAVFSLVIFGFVYVANRTPKENFEQSFLFRGVIFLTFILSVWGTWLKNAENKSAENAEEMFVMEAEPQGEQDAGGFATQEQIVGIWKLEYKMSTPFINNADPWPMPYQWFGIYADGTIKTFMTSEAMSPGRKDLEQIFNASMSVPIKYSFDQGFMFVQYPDDPSQTYMWGVNYFTESRVIANEVFIQPGDLMMTLDDGRGNVAYYRHLRRVE